MTVLEDAARSYVHAYRQNRDAEPKDWMAALARLDGALHDLILATDSQCECDEQCETA